MIFECQMQKKRGKKVTSKGELMPDSKEKKSHPKGNECQIPKKKGKKTPVQRGINARHLGWKKNQSKIS